METAESNNQRLTGKIEVMDDKTLKDFFFNLQDMREFTTLYLPDDAPHIMDMFTVWAHNKIKGGGSPDLVGIKLQTESDQRKEYQDE